MEAVSLAAFAGKSDHTTTSSIAGSSDIPQRGFIAQESAMERILRASACRPTESRCLPGVRMTKGKGSFHERGFTGELRLLSRCPILSDTRA